MPRSQVARATLVIALVAAVVAVPGASGGRGGLVDPRFGTRGVTVTDLGGDDYLADVAAAGDGRLVAAGASERPVPEGIESRFVVSRYTADGRPDPTFSGSGTVLTEGGARRADAVASLPDGRVIAGGNGFRGRSSDFVLARYSESGALDPGFGEGGLVFVDFEGRFDAVTGLAVAPDGSVTALGFTASFAEPNSADLAIVRVDGDGQLDPALDGDGRLRLDLGGLEAPDDLLLQPDGKIVVVGSTAAPPAGGRMLVGRLNRDGSPDPTFGGDGLVETDRAPPNEFASGVAAQPDGKLIVGAGGEGLAAARYTATGELDPTFGSGGVAVARVEGGAVAVDVAVQTNGKVVVLGASVARGFDQPTFALARLLPNGRVDPRFGTASGVTVGAGPERDFPSAIALAPDGGVIAAGTRRTEPQAGDFLLTRYIPGTCSVPALRGVSLAAARKRLAGANCRLGAISAVRSARVRRGRVVRQRPAARRELPDWAPVAVTVSRGRSR